MRKGGAGQLEIAILHQFLAIELHFVRNGSRDKRDDLKSQFYFSFWRSDVISCERVRGTTCKSQFYFSLAIEPHFVRKGCAGQVEIAILPQLLAIEPHFVRKGCVSRRLVGTAPRLQKRNRKEGEGKRARGQEEKM